MNFANAQGFSVFPWTACRRIDFLRTDRIYPVRFSARPTPPTGQALRSDPASDCQTALALAGCAFLHHSLFLIEEFILLYIMNAFVFISQSHMPLEK